MIVAIDYFTKWIEAKPLVRIKEENAINFMYERLWCQFGIPRGVIFDHGKQFEDDFTEACERLHVRHYKSSIAHH